MQMGRGRGDAGSAFPLRSKTPPPPLPSFYPSTVCCEWEKACIHEDQLEGIPISTTGVFPSGVLFSSEETVLFHPIQGANWALLCVCVSVYVVCTAPLTERTLNKCHPMPRTGPPLQLPLIPAAAHVSVRASRLIRSPPLVLLRPAAPVRPLADITSSYSGTFSCLHKKML